MIDLVAHNAILQRVVLELRGFPVRERNISNRNNDWDIRALVFTAPDHSVGSVSRVFVPIHGVVVLDP